MSKLDPKRVMELRAYSESFVAEREALYGERADANGADKARLSIALCDAWLAQQQDARGYDPVHLSMLYTARDNAASPIHAASIDRAIKWIEQHGPPAIDAAQGDAK